MNKFIFSNGSSISYKNKPEDETLKYKSYTGSILYSEEDECYHGKILGIDDLVTFEGSDLKELEADFKEAVDDYVDFIDYLNKPSEYVNQFPFASKLEIETNSCAGTLNRLKKLVDTLCKEYGFKPAEIKEDRENYSLVVTFSSGYTEIQKEWMLECLKYHTPAGIDVVECG